MADDGGRFDMHGLVGREGRVDSLGNRIGRTRARLELAEEWVARHTSGRCSLFCGDYACPSECSERDAGAER